MPTLLKVPRLVCWQDEYCLILATEFVEAAAREGVEVKYWTREEGHGLLVAQRLVNILEDHHLWPGQSRFVRGLDWESIACLQSAWRSGGPRSAAWISLVVAMVERATVGGLSLASYKPHFDEDLMPAFCLEVDARYKEVVGQMRRVHDETSTLRFVELNMEVLIEVILKEEQILANCVYSKWIDLALGKRAAEEEEKARAEQVSLMQSGVTAIMAGRLNAPGVEIVQEMARREGQEGVTTRARSAVRETDRLTLLDEASSKMWRRR